MKRWLWVSMMVAAAGCNGSVTLNQATYERMMLPLMSDVQKAGYYKQPTWAERKAYLYEIGLLQKFESAPPAIRRAIRAGRVIKGMTPDYVLMSWGVPGRRVVIGPSDQPDVAEREGRKEQWLYGRVLTPDLSIRFQRLVGFTNGVVLYVRDDRRSRGR